MRNVVALANQMPLDIAVQQYSDARAVIGLLTGNNISITASLAPGQEVTTALPHRKRLAIVPATAPGTEPELNIAEVVYIVPTTHNRHTDELTIEGQTAMDIVIQAYGNRSALLDLLSANNISITGAIAPGTKLNKARSNYTDTDADVVAYYRSHGHKPATAPEVDMFIQHLFETGLFEFGLFE